MLKKEWPSDRERLEWHKRLISNPFGSKMVPHCITTSAFTADNFGHRVQSIYLRIRQLKSTKHHTKNTQPKTFWFCTFYLPSETHQNLKIIESYYFIRKCNISQSILKESLLKKVWSQRLMGFMSLAPIQCTFSIHITCLSLSLA